jgi:hypothetical protein
MMFGVVAMTLASPAQSAESAALEPLPARLSETGLYVPGSTTVVRQENVAFAPQYPLWSDGTTKRRWIHLPPGTAIDASNPDAWEFPPGTRLWKEFSFGRPVETRLIERQHNGAWRYATYVWNADGSDAVLDESKGRTIPIEGAPRGRYTILTRVDCTSCHEGGSVPVLGFSALQLSADRDPMAPHAQAAPAGADLKSLVDRGMIRNLPQALLDRPPRIEGATEVERAALGYLHGNCGHCHNGGGALGNIEFQLARGAADRGRPNLESLIAHASRYRQQGAKSAQRVIPGDAAASTVVMRMETSNPLARMPPVGVERVDDEGIALVRRWIEQSLPNHP